MTHLQSTGCVDVNLHAKNNHQPLRWFIFQFHDTTPLVYVFTWTVHLELGMHIIYVFFTRCHTQPEPPAIKTLQGWPVGMVESLVSLK